ncbi:MAG: sugar phosphate isomerase/epimerase, partial [Nitrospira sp.]|nr:sugar phosphate isomerase/epimerase [Nitrospira sp.]
MPRPVILFTGSWADVPLVELAPKLNDWGYQGVELCCWGEHFDVARAHAEEGYCQEILDLLARFELQPAVLSAHRLGQAVSDRVDARHRQILPERVWGDGDPVGVSQRAAEEMIAAIRAAQKLGVSVVSGFTGSPLWPGVMAYPATPPPLVEEGFTAFARQWNPILDECAAAGIRFALEVHPGQIAFDLHSAERALEALDGREEFGFTFDPTHLFWQGIDPVEFLRRFPDRIYHVHVKDIALNLNGRNSLLGSYLP